MIQDFRYVHELRYQDAGGREMTARITTQFRN